MDNTSPHQISTCAYIPNSLSIFPDLLRPLNGMETSTPVGDQISTSAYIPNSLSIFPDLLHPINGMETSTPLRPSANNPNSLSIFPDLLHEINPMEAQQQLEPRVIPQHPPGEDGMFHLNPISGAPQLPREEPQAPENNVQCPICLDPFFQPTTTRCGHVFCKNCINCALRKKKQCPICRKRVTKRDLFRIYLS